MYVNFNENLTFGKMLTYLITKIDGDFLLLVRRKNQKHHFPEIFNIVYLKSEGIANEIFTKTLLR